MYRQLRCGFDFVLHHLCCLMIMTHTTNRKVIWAFDWPAMANIRPF